MLAYCLCVAKTVPVLPPWACSSGNYRDLPSAIERLKPAEPLTPAEETSKLRHVTHLIYSHLLKVQNGAEARLLKGDAGILLLYESVANGLQPASMSLAVWTTCTC